jgi:hypothetical protein
MNRQAWDFTGFVCKSSPGSVTTRINLKTVALPDLKIDNMEDKVFKIDKDGRVSFNLGTVKGHVTKRHNKMTIAVNLSIF